MGVASCTRTAPGSKTSRNSDRSSGRFWVKNYDPSRYLECVRMPILFCNGTNDKAYPLDSYQKSYRLVKSPRNLCVTVRMPHSHPAGWGRVEVGLFVDSVLRGGKPLARFDDVKRRGAVVRASFRSAV